MTRKTKNRKSEVIPKLFSYMINGDNKKQAAARRIYHNIMSYKHYPDNDLRIKMLNQDEEALMADPVYQKLILAGEHLAEKYSYNPFELLTESNKPYYENGGVRISEHRSDMARRQMTESTYKFIADSSVEEVVQAIEMEARLKHEINDYMN